MSRPADGLVALQSVLKALDEKLRLVHQWKALEQQVCSHSYTLIAELQLFIKPQ